MLISLPMWFVYLIGIYVALVTLSVALAIVNWCVTKAIKLCTKPHVWVVVKREGDVKLYAYMNGGGIEYSPIYREGFRFTSRYDAERFANGDDWQELRVEKHYI